MSQVIGQTRLAYTRTWHHIDIGRALTPSTPTTLTSTRPPQPTPLGRIASRIALTLMGKHKPTYAPSTDCGDYVVATGCSDLHVTGKKKDQKLYRTHTTRPGSLKEISMQGLMGKYGGGEVLRRAVRGMLPKNRLRDRRLARLRCFEGVAHPYRQEIVRNRREWIVDLARVQQAGVGEKEGGLPGVEA